MRTTIRRLSVVAVLLLLLGSPPPSVRGPDLAAFDPDDELVIHPPTGVGSGSGTFDYLDNAIDEAPLSAALGAVAVACHDTCNNQQEKQATWQGFPDGFEPIRLEVWWDTTTAGMSLVNGRAAQVHLLLEYDIGQGWQTAQEDTWNSEIPPCSEAHPSRCSGNFYEKELSPEQSTGVIKVRATVSAQMTTCGDCGLFDTSHLNVTMAIRDIQIVAKPPRLIAEPGYTVTRGDTVTFRVVGAPVTSYSNWRYKFSPIVHQDIVRSDNINTESWAGPLLLSGRASVVVIVPGQSVSIPLQTDPVITVNPRSWNSPPEGPHKVTGITPVPPGVFSSTTNLNGHPGYSTWELEGQFDAVKLDQDGPNKGLNFVTAVRHDEDPLVHFSYEIAPELEGGGPGSFYAHQCGQGGFILNSVLRSNVYEHESGTVKGHYQQYRDKLADPTVNYAKYAEPLWGGVGQALQTFQATVQSGFNSRRTTLHSAAVIQACNQYWNIDATCTSRGNVNLPPYHPHVSRRSSKCFGPSSCSLWLPSASREVGS